MNTITDDFRVAFRSPDPQKLFMRSVSILVRPNGRYVVSFDRSDRFGKLYISDDKGKT